MTAVQLVNGIKKLGLNASLLALQVFQNGIDLGVDLLRGLGGVQCAHQTLNHTAG